MFYNLAEKGNSTWTRSASPSYYCRGNSGMLTELCCVLTSARAVVGPPTHRKAGPHQPSGSSPFVLRPPPGVKQGGLRGRMRFTTLPPTLGAGWSPPARGTAAA